MKASIYVLACLICLGLNPIYSVAHAQSNCEVLDWNSHPDTADEIVFAAEDAIWFGTQVNEAYVYTPGPYAPAATSADGSKLVWINTGWLENEVTSSELHLLDLNNGRHRVTEIYADPYYAPYRIYWIDNQDLLTVYATVQNRLRAYYAFSIIDWQTLDPSYIAPLEVARSLVEQGHVLLDLLSYDPFLYFDVVPRFSPNGHFILDADRYKHFPLIFDIESQEIRELGHGGDDYWYSGGFWSADSTQLLYLRADPATNVSPYLYDYRIEIYDAQSVSFEKLSTIDIGTLRQIFLTDHSWSPDKRYLAITTDDGRHRNVELYIADLETRKLIRTCFDLSTRFEHGELYRVRWSPDGRYLALNGVLANDSDMENDTIYVYDTLSGSIYSVYIGDAEIIGWVKKG